MVKAVSAVFINKHDNESFRRISLRFDCLPVLHASLDKKPPECKTYKIYRIEIGKINKW